MPEHAKHCASSLKQDAEAQNLRSCLSHSDLTRNSRKFCTLKTKALAKTEQTFRKHEPDLQAIPSVRFKTGASKQEAWAQLSAWCLEGIPCFPKKTLGLPGGGAGRMRKGFDCVPMGFLPMSFALVGNGSSRACGFWGFDAV